MKILPLPLLVLTGALSAFVFLIAVAQDAAASYVLIKALAVFSLAAWTWSRADWRITAGLILGGIGDILLLLPSGFLPGMAAFALGHLAYVWAFIRWERRLSLPLVWPVMAYIGWTLSMIVAGAGAMTLPVTAYGLIIGLMIWRAAAVAQAPNPNSNPTARAMGATAHWAPLAGALLFGFSDTLISINMFSTPLSSAHYVIMVTYWGGQSLIATAGVARSG